MLKTATSPKNQGSFDQGNISRFVSDLGDILPIAKQSPSGDRMNKCHILGILQTVLSIYYKKRMLIPVGRTPVLQESVASRKFNVVISAGVVPRLKTWKNCLFSWRFYC